MPPSSPRNPLVRLFIGHALIGFGLATLFIAAVLYFNPADLGRLISNTPLAGVILWFFVGLTFASVQMGIAIMSMSDDDDDDKPSGGKRQRTPQLAMLPRR